MCGIVGYVGPRPVLELLLAGLEKLEYRGYDSAGVAVLADGRIDPIRAVGNLSALRAAVEAARLDGGRVVAGAAAESETAIAATRPAREGATAAAAAGTANGRAPAIGIGHTRWATHGRVTEANAHPHAGGGGRIQVVVNGIIENFRELRDRLQAAGSEFSSQTDAEVVAHLIASHDGGDLVAAVSAAYAELEGHFAFVAISAGEPGLLVGARRECPLVIGRGDGEQFVASALPAFLSETRRVQLVEDGEIAVIRAGDVRLQTAAGVPVQREVTEVDWDSETAEKGGYETFMLKEIHEQPEAIAETIADRTAPGDRVDLTDLGAAAQDALRDARRIVIVACGTSYHAGLIGRYAIEEWARVPVEVEIASEYRYRNPVVGDRDLVIGISQSGETRDTLAAMRVARERGATVLAVTNVMGSQAARESDAVLYTRAGLEIGVAATKTFVSQVAAMYLLALRLGELRGALDQERLAELVGALKRMPEQITQLIERASPIAEQIAAEHHRATFFLYLGRHAGLPIALEGALKLKEISYVATDAYPAGEMKHGPIALLDERTPVVCVATDSPVIDKVVSNMEEVRARGAHLIAVGSDGDERVAGHAAQVITVPRTDAMLAPALAVVPLQLIAYHIARLRGLNVDQPRNLAKTVTVE